MESPISLDLDKETQDLIRKELQAGRFPNASALVGAAVKHYIIARELGEEYTPQEIEEKIARGIAQLEGGEGVDGDEFFEKLRLRGEDLRRRRA